MTRIKLVGLALMAVFAFSAVAATAASAVEGPFWKVGTARLAAGETRLLLASAKANYVLTASAIKITCTGLSLPTANQMAINGSSGANAGTSKEVIKFSTCTVVGNGTGCLVGSGKTITTSPVVNTLGYSAANRTGPILVLFAPETGKVFVTVNFTPEEGGKCTVSSTAVEGSTVGAAQANGTGVVVGSEPVVTVKGEVAFGATNKTIWTEQGGSLTSVKAKLTSFGVESKLEGVSIIEVDGASNAWGVFTA